MEYVSAHRRILKAAGTVLDPRTKRATAFYMAVGVTVWDVIKGGLTVLNLGGLLVLAGVVAADSIIAGAKAERATKDPGE